MIRYDPPGTGVSADGDLPAASVDDEAAALAAVIEAAADGPVDLFAGSSGAPIGIAYAAAHPEQLERLVLYGGYASGSEIADARARKAIVALVREHWGLGSRALADVFIPSADPGEREAFVEFQRHAASADRAARSLEAVYAFDVAAASARCAPAHRHAPPRRPGDPLRAGPRAGRGAPGRDLRHPRRRRSLPLVRRFRPDPAPSFAPSGSRRPAARPSRGPARSAEPTASPS